MTQTTRPIATDLLWDLDDRRVAPLATLVLLPHAGGMAQGYGAWARWFPASVRLVAAQYPGRGPRYGQEPAGDIAALADPLAEVLADIDPPVHVFGHSLGALLGFEVCWRLQRAGRPAAGLYASAASAPQVHRGAAESPDQVPDARLAAILTERGALPSEVRDDPDLLDMVLDACRADMVLTHRYRYGAERRILRCPLIAFGGDADTAVPVAKLDRWVELTTGPAEVKVFSGGHFYLHEHIAAVTAAIRGWLPTAAGTAPGAVLDPRGETA